LCKHPSDRTEFSTYYSNYNNTMGGDGGVIASNRRYMRGAGTADHTGDSSRHNAQKVNAQEVMTTCALTKTPLHTSSSISSGAMIVADVYGSLYHKEAAVEALLARKQQQQQNGNTFAIESNTIGAQVRKLSDLYQVRFHRQQEGGFPACPITAKALTGKIQAILLVPGKPDVPNVVSESALSHISPEELETEYGPLERRIHLAPNHTLLETIKEQIEQEREKEHQEKLKKKEKKKKKRKNGKEEKRHHNNTTSGDKRKRIDNENVKGATHSSDTIRSRVNTAVEQNSVLSSLFTNKNAASKLSEKEKKDNLFAR